MDDLSRDQLEYILQFQHPDKALARLPGVSPELISALFDIPRETYREIRNSFAESAKDTAAELLQDAAFAQRVSALPFAPGQTVVALGDSITDDLQSWAEILRCLLDLGRPDDGIHVINAGFSGDTTTHIICRFGDVVALDPDWILCMVGTNDTRLHGKHPSKTLVSADETERNLAMIRNYGATQTQARWVWLAPPGVVEEWIPQHWFLGPLELMWRNSDLSAVADMVVRRPEPSVDLRDIFGTQPRTEYLLSDGLHPCLTGQRAIVKAVVERLTAL